MSISITLLIRLAEQEIEDLVEQAEQLEEEEGQKEAQNEEGEAAASSATGDASASETGWLLHLLILSTIHFIAICTINVSA